MVSYPEVFDERQSLGGSVVLSDIVLAVDDDGYWIQQLLLQSCLQLIKHLMEGQIEVGDGHDDGDGDVAYRIFGFEKRVLFRICHIFFLF
jgi:hypothetical protein